MRERRLRAWHHLSCGSLRGIYFREWFSSLNTWQKRRYWRGGLKLPAEYAVPLTQREQMERQLAASAGKTVIIAGASFVSPPCGFAISVIFTAEEISSNPRDPVRWVFAIVDLAIGIRGLKKSTPRPVALQPGDRFSAYFDGSDGIIATVDKNGVFTFYVSAGPNTPRGGVMFAEAIEAYGDNVKSVRGLWLNVDEIRDNFDSYWKAIHNGATPEEAAFKTFTGHMAAKYGFTRARVIQADGGEVCVEFSK